MIGRREKKNVALAAAGQQIAAALRHRCLSRCSEHEEHCESAIGVGEKDENENNGFAVTKTMCVRGEGRKL